MVVTAATTTGAAEEECLAAKFETGSECRVTHAPDSCTEGCFDEGSMGIGVAENSELAP